MKKDGEFRRTTGFQDIGMRRHGQEANIWRKKRGGDGSRARQWSKKRERQRRKGAGI